MSYVYFFFTMMILCQMLYRKSMRNVLWVAKGHDFVKVAFIAYIKVKFCRNSLVCHELKVVWPEIQNLLELLNPPLIHQPKLISVKIKIQIKYISMINNVVVMCQIFTYIPYDTIYYCFIFLLLQCKDTPVRRRKKKQSVRLSEMQNLQVAGFIPYMCLTVPFSFIYLLSKLQKSMNFGHCKKPS